MPPDSFVAQRPGVYTELRIRPTRRSPAQHTPVVTSRRFRRRLSRVRVPERWFQPLSPWALSSIVPLDAAGHPTVPSDPVGRHRRIASVRITPALDDCQSLFEAARPTLVLYSRSPTHSVLAASAPAYLIAFVSISPRSNAFPAERCWPMLLHLPVEVGFHNYCYCNGRWRSVMNTKRAEAADCDGCRSTAHQTRNLSGQYLPVISDLQRNWWDA